MTILFKSGFWLSLLGAIAASLADFTNELNDDGIISNSTLIGSFMCDNAEQKEFTHQLELLNTACEKLNLKMDMYNIRLQMQFTTQRSEMLQQIKDYLEVQLQKTTFSSCASPAPSCVSPSPENLIDVRSNFVSDEKTVPKPCSPLPSVSAPTYPPESCTEALTAAGRSSGIYELQLQGFDLKPFYVYCLQDTQNGGAWTIVQRRQDGSIRFQRDWAAYKRGFGSLNGEFFIGLDKLHALTHSQKHELRIEMEDFEGARRFAAYDEFAIADESSNYELHVLGKFSGDAGDSLRLHAGQEFTTRDADHDAYEKNCAVEFTGAWWYERCHNSNLNGQYLHGECGSDTHAKGINWKSWHHYNYSLKYVHMAIRPIKLH